MRLEKKDTIGLMIDIQERLLPVMYNKETLLKNCLILIRGLKTLGIPLMVTQQYTQGLGKTTDTLAGEIPEFTPIEKRDFSCCDEPAVLLGLEKHRAQNIIIFGIESHVCVLQSAVDLKHDGYNPIVVMDCVSSRSEKDIELAGERFRYEGIMTGSYESVLFELTRSLKAKEFKEISGLVR